MYSVSKFPDYTITISSSKYTSSAVSSLPPLLTESRTPLTCKFVHPKQLDSMTNSLSCHKQVSIYLHVADIYKYVDASTRKPTDATQLATWTNNDYTAKADIMSLLSENFIHLASDIHTAQDAWKARVDYRDLRNSSTRQQTVPSFFPTTMQHAAVLTDYIYSYIRKHTYDTERCPCAIDQSAYRNVLE